MTEESAHPGTCRSKVGCEAMDEPCTNKILPAGPEGSPACLFHRNRRTSLPLSVQCSSPRMTAAGEMGLFTVRLLVLDVSPRLFRLYVVGFDELGPFVDLGLHKGTEFVGLHRHCLRALLPPRLFYVRAREDFVDLGVQEGDDRPPGSRRRHDADPNPGFIAGGPRPPQPRHVGQDG